MIEKINRPKYLYHATSVDNFSEIIKDRILIPKGKRINGLDEDTVSLFDVLSRWVEHYGHIIIEFKASQIFIKNKIYPYNYGINEDDPEFYDLPFWEAEWRAKKVKFDYHDINKTYIIEDNFLSTVDKINIIKILIEKNIKFKVIKIADLTNYSENYFIRKYKERINLSKIYNNWRNLNELRKIL
ncbi:MAG: hypothetical protein NC899_06150 [Candidatus Omnitrophica bacterium]|nr:hypothetical protein [Candidatus Omnitrophota bacterium]